MGLQITTPVSVLTPPSGDVKVNAKVWLTTTATTQADAFYLRKGTTIVKLEALVESTNAGAVTLSVGSPTTTNHYVSAFALSTNIVAQQLVAPITNLTTFSELTEDTKITAQISGAPASGKVTLLCHFVE
jgi:hypothetical protein